MIKDLSSILGDIPDLANFSLAVIGVISFLPGVEIHFERNKWLFRIVGFMTVMLATLGIISSHVQKAAYEQYTKELRVKFFF